jgi:hypothetical protein
MLILIDYVVRYWVWRIQATIFAVQDALEALMKTVDAEIEQILVSESVFSIGNYGWLDHETPDPEYMGHNLWQTDPPFEPDFSGMMNGEVVKYEPTTRDEVLTRNGEDFVAVMIAARRSMGMSFVRARSIQAAVNSEEFWQEYSTCTMLLSIASDRLRDFLVMAVDGIDFENLRRENDRGRAIKGAIPKIPGLAAFVMEILRFKEIRDDIVHRLAMLPARRMLNSLRTQKEHAISGRPVKIWVPTAEEWESVMAQSMGGPTLDAEIDQMKKWHHCLIEASNLVFRAENDIRRARTEGTFPDGH